MVSSHSASCSWRPQYWRIASTCPINYGHLADLQKALPTIDLNKNNFHLIKYLLATFIFVLSFQSVLVYYWEGLKYREGVKIPLRYIDAGVKISYDILTPGSIYRGSKYRLTPARIHRIHDNVMKWNHFPRYWPFVREIHVELSCFLWSASEHK